MVTLSEKVIITIITCISAVAISCLFYYFLGDGESTNLTKLPTATTTTATTTTTTTTALTATATLTTATTGPTNGGGTTFRHLMGSTDQADPSCFYFRIS